VLTTGLLAALVGALMGNARIQPAHTYRRCSPTSLVCSAASTSARLESQLAKSWDGTARRQHRASELRCADIDPAHPRDAGPIRYKNLTGDRYLDLTKGRGRCTAGRWRGHFACQDAASSGSGRTVQRFQTVATGLDPGEVNQLSSSLIEVFQGQSAPWRACSPISARSPRRLPTATG